MSEQITFTYSRETKESLQQLAEELNTMGNRYAKGKDNYPQMQEARTMVKALLATTPTKDENEDIYFSGTIQKKQAIAVIPTILDAVLQYKYMNENVTIRVAMDNILSGKQKNLQENYTLPFDTKEIVRDLTKIAQENGFAHTLYEPAVANTTLAEWKKEYKKKTGEDLTELMNIVEDHVGIGYRVPEVRAAEPDYKMSEDVELRIPNRIRLYTVRNPGKELPANTTNTTGASLEGKLIDTKITPPTIPDF